MKRPSAQRIKEAVRKDAAGIHGKKEYVEAVELEDGIVIVEYTHRMHVPDVDKDLVSKRLVIDGPDHIPFTSTILEGEFE